MSQLEKMVILDNIHEDGSEVAETITTRFGKITLQRRNAFHFSRGLLGMPDKRNYFLTLFPSKKLEKFKLMQCLDDYTLSFITLPVELHNTIIASHDLLAASADLGIKPENLVVLLIVSVHRLPDKTSISVNARAPLLIDSSQKFASQYVFQNDAYKVQHYITA